MSTAEDRHTLARRRALRAARAVTLGLFALGAGCAATAAPAPSRELATADADTADAADAAVADAADAMPATDGDPRCDRDAGTEAYVACCEAVQWDFARGCEAWGPFVPPSLEG